MPFRLKLILSIALLIAITFGIGGTLLIATSFDAALSEERTAAMHTYETVRSTLFLLNSLGEKSDYGVLSDALIQMELQGVARWQAISLKSQERVVYENGDQRFLSAALPVPETGRCAYVVTLDDAKTVKYSLQVASVLSAGEEQLVLRASFDLSSAYRARQTQQKLYLEVYLVVVLLGIAMAAVLSFALTRQLKRLTGTVRQISEGNLSQRSGLRSRDEFGQLSRDVDTMADKLQANIRELEDSVRRKEAFMGAFAHELKTPMTSIIGYADLLRQDALEGPNRIAAAGYIYSEGQRLEKLSFQILDLLLLEKDTVEKKQVPLPVLLGNVDKALGPVMKQKGILLICRSDPGTVTVAPELMMSLLYNLVDNAFKAMEGEGAILVKGEITPQMCRIRVIDNGRGMEEEELSRITEAFYRVDKARSRQQGGAGLGLSLCSKIVEAHGGRMEFQSRLGRGTCVSVVLPTDGRKEHG